MVRRRGPLLLASLLALAALGAVGCRDTARWSQPEGIPSYPGGPPPVGYIRERSNPEDEPPPAATPRDDDRSPAEPDRDAGLAAAPHHAAGPDAVAPDHAEAPDAAATAP